MVGHDRIAVRETSPSKGQRKDKQGEAVKLRRCGTSRFSAGQRDREEGCGAVLGRGARAGVKKRARGGLVVAYHSRRHEDTIPRRRRSPFACTDLSAYLYFFIMNF